MKKISLLFSALLSFIILLNSCGGGDTIAEIDLIPVKSGDEFQFIDREGKIVINPQFSYATILRDGLALVKTSGDNPQWGFIDKEGKYKINSNYIQATVFSEGLAIVVSENGAPTIVDKNGETKATLTQAETVRWFKDGLAAYSVSDNEGKTKWGFVNSEGSVVINPQFDGVIDFKNGYGGVRNSEGKWGFIDKEGKYIINPQFESVKRFKSNKCVVESGGKKGLIDENGTYIINPQYDDIIKDNDMYLIKKDGKWGWSDENGNLIINPQFKEAFPFLNNDKTPVKSGNEYGYINKDGILIINSQFDYALPFNGKLALVSSNNMIGFIDSKGKYVINPQFDGVSQDLVEYMQTGGSKYTSVNTDYFNVGAVTNVIDFIKPEGMNLDQIHNLESMKIKFEDLKIRKYYSSHKAYKNKKISNDAKVSLTLSTDFNSESKEMQVNAFIYSINLSNNGISKADVLFKEFNNNIPSEYEKNEEKSRKNKIIYESSTDKTEKTIIIIKSNQNQVDIKISFDIKVNNLEEIEDYNDYSDNSLSNNDKKIT